MFSFLASAALWLIVDSQYDFDQYTLEVQEEE